MINALKKEMVSYYSGDPKRIQHFIKVHAFAKEIGEAEYLPEGMQFVLETAAVVHDIGIKVCEEKYGECGGKLQEKEGPALAEAMLKKLGYEEGVIKRVSYLVGHHHTYQNIDGLDYQILVEADFLVNLYEDGVDKKAATNAYERIFQTERGKFLCREMFALQQ